MTRKGRTILYVCMAPKAVNMASKSSCVLILSLTVMIVVVSAHRPLEVNRNQAAAGSSMTKMDTNVNMLGKTGYDGKFNHIGDRMKASTVLGIFPIPIPGSDGHFEFQIGPIGFGWNWDFGQFPGPIFSYGQPIVVSPYSPPSTTPPYLSPSPGMSSPYTNVQPYGNVQPYQQQPGSFQGPFGSYSPYPFGQYAPGSNQVQSPASEHK